jgi:hypothetical protein
MPHPAEAAALSLLLQSGLPITFACPWGGGGLEVYREPPLPFAQKTGLVAFIASNCHAGAAAVTGALSHHAAGGALARTRYVQELMKRTPTAVPARPLLSRLIPSQTFTWTRTAIACATPPSRPTWPPRLASTCRRTTGPTLGPVRAWGAG